MRESQRRGDVSLCGLGNALLCAFPESNTDSEDMGLLHQCSLSPWNTPRLVIISFPGVTRLLCGWRLTFAEEASENARGPGHCSVLLTVNAVKQEKHWVVLTECSLCPFHPLNPLPTFSWEHPMLLFFSFPCYQHRKPSLHPFMPQLPKWCLRVPHQLGFSLSVNIRNNCTFIIMFTIPFFHEHLLPNTFAHLL